LAWLWSLPLPDFMVFAGRHQPAYFIEFSEKRMNSQFSLRPHFYLLVIHQFSFVISAYHLLMVDGACVRVAAGR
jgi:hypothetical protein